MEAIAFSSGCAAIATVLSSLGPNAHILSSSVVYGGTFRYMTQVAAENQGLEATFIDLEQASDDEIYAEIKENTKVTKLSCASQSSRAQVILHCTADMARVANKPYFRPG